MIRRFFIKNPLNAIFVVILLDFLSIGLTVPILPPLFKDEARNLFQIEISQQWREILYGMLSGIFFLATFLGAPIVGALSDRYGRRKLLLFTTSFSILAYSIISIGIYLKWITLIFIGRIISGMVGSILIIINSAISDISTPESKARNFGITGVAFGVGFIMGPALGGILADPSIVSWFDYPVPYASAALLLVFNLLFVVLVFPETIRKTSYSDISAMTGFRNIKKAFTNKTLRVVFMVIFILALGFTFFTQFFPVYLINKFSFSQTEIGYIFAWIGLWVAIAQGIVLRPVTRYFSPVGALKIAIPLFAVSYIFVMLPAKAYHLYYIVPIMAIFQGITFPNLLAIISNTAGDDIQGEVIGINQSVQAMAAFMPPVLLGFAVTLNMNFTLYFGFVSTFIAWIVFMVFYVKRKDPIVVKT